MKETFVFGVCVETFVNLFEGGVYMAVIGIIVKPSYNTGQTIQ